MSMDACMLLYNKMYERTVGAFLHLYLILSLSLFIDKLNLFVQFVNLSLKLSYFLF